VIVNQSDSTRYTLEKFADLDKMTRGIDHVATARNRRVKVLHDFGHAGGTAPSGSTDQSDDATHDN
jgi:hypothetical protein